MTAGEVRILQAPAGSPIDWTVAISEDGLARKIRMGAPELGGGDLDHPMPGREQGDYLDLFVAAARTFNLRAPLGRQTSEPAEGPALTPLLTSPVSPDILYGYGDPSVLRVEDGPDQGWWLVVTSNDAPEVFPILRSDDLRTWRPAGFVFPEGRTPGWSLTGEHRADFWAPEMHRVGEEVWVCFAAREHDRSLAVGLARAPGPGGPFTPDPAPLVGGGVIDPHLVLDREGAPWLLWKRDDNDIWPGLLADRLHDRPELITALFPTAPDSRTASLQATLWPWTRTLEPMERFFVLQPLIEAVTADFAGFRDRLAAQPGGHAAILEALRTRILAQRLAPDGRSLLGRPQLVIENDQPWEAHLIEGVWITPHAGRWLLFYAGNDFSTPDYGIGVAVADDPLGPYRKAPRPLISSTRPWSGPGHPSVATGPDGRPLLFLHAFRPGEVGYKAFRALLFMRFELEGDEVVLRPG